jgi:hypothetical protein
MVVEGPGMIRTLKALGIPGWLPADERPAVGTGVQQDTHLAIAAACQDDRPARHMSGAKVSGIWDLGFMARIDPALFEDLSPFQFADDWVGKYTPIDPK